MSKPTKHHLTPKSRKGNAEEANILMLWRENHNAWHVLFGNRTLEEIIAVLCRIRDAKHR